MNTGYDPTRASDPQALRITDELVTSLATGHHARRLTGEGGWLVTWFPGRVLTRDQAVTAMTLAATVATEQLHCGHPMWEQVDRWAAELGLSGPEAVARAGEPVGFAYWWGDRGETVCDEQGRPVRWITDPAPGGYVCGVADPDGPDGVCGMPVESEPCPVHFPTPGSDVGDPGPLPEVVEPDGNRRITTVAASPNVRVSVIENVGHTGRVGLSLMTATGEVITAALDSAAVDVLLEALAAAVPVPYVPELPEVAVYRPRVDRGGEA